MIKHYVSHKVPHYVDSDDPFSEAEFEKVNEENLAQIQDWEKARREQTRLA